MKTILTSIIAVVRWRSAIRILVVAGIIGSYSLSAAAEPLHEYSGLYVFGDSLSDPGNAYALQGTFSVPPYDPIPSAPYEIGGFHFTNGKTWIEQLAPKLDLRRGAKPAFQRPGIFGNYAIGASRAGSSGSPLQTLAGQVGAFLDDASGAAPPDALYTIWLGSNDVRDALEAAFADPTLATSFLILDAAVAAEADGISQLYDAGARHFLVLNVPNVALAPIVADGGPAAAAIALALSAAFNNRLANALDELTLTASNIDIIHFDTFRFISTVVANPAVFGLNNVVDTCLSFFVIEDVICEQPSRYLFWDAIHPTRAGHRILARQILNILTD